MDLPKDSSLRRPILIMQKSGVRAAAIVQDLLTLARRGAASKEVVDLNRIVSEYLRSPEYDMLLTLESGVEIEVHLSDELLTSPIDPFTFPRR